MTPDRVWLLANGRSEHALEAKPGEPVNDVGIVDANAVVDHLLQACWARKLDHHRGLEQGRGEDAVFTCAAQKLGAISRPVAWNQSRYSGF